VPNGSTQAIKSQHKPEEASTKATDENKETNQSTNRHWLSYYSPPTPDRIREIRKRIGDERYKNYNPIKSKIEQKLKLKRSKTIERSSLANNLVDSKTADKPMASIIQNSTSVNKISDVNKVTCFNDAYRLTNEIPNDKDLAFSYAPTDYNYIINSYKENDSNNLRENQKYDEPDLILNYVNSKRALIEESSRLKNSKDNLNV
jgi:hypothetical protein